MLIVKKEMKQELVKYLASDAESMQIEKCNIHKDGICETIKLIDLNKTKVHDRYFTNAGSLFEYLVSHKGYEREQ